jgi:uncharacterized protein YjiS (DUF1127 family)
MSCITIDSGPHRLTNATSDGGEQQGILAGLLRVALSLVSACRSGAALAMMSERDLDDLGLLTWEVQSEMDGGADDRAAIRRFRTPASCNQV